ncbi:MAG: hypothetical protein WC470_00355 [Candidatus Paceibacterota bacterium]
MNTKINSSLIISLVLLLAAGGVVYFLDLPQYKKMQDTQAQIANLKAQQQKEANYNSEIAKAGQSLNEANWTEAQKKIDPNFSNDPFYASKMEIFFKDIIGRSGMALSSLGFNSTSSVSGGSDSKAKSAAAAKTAPAGSGIAGVTGPVKANPVTISVTGTYEQFKGLLKILEKQAYLISVKSINFSGGTASTNYSISAEVYSY